MKRILAVTVLGLLFSATATAKKEKLDPRTFESVALVAFGGEMEIEPPPGKRKHEIQRSVEEITAQIALIQGVSDGSLREGAASRSGVFFETVERGLEAQLGWQVIDLADMVDEEAYMTMWNDKTPEINKTLSAKWGAGLCPEGVLHKDLISTLGTEERDALMAELNVEHLAVAGINISSVEVFGPKAVKLKAYVTVKVFAKGEKKPVWNGLAVGAATEGEVLAGFSSKEPDALPLMVESLHLAMQKLGEKFPG